MKQEKNKSPKIALNYLYFGLFFFFLSLLSFDHLVSIDGQMARRSFFLLYSVLQSFFEVSLLLIASWSLKRWGKPWMEPFFIGGSFVLMLFHIINFMMVRIMDTSVIYVFKYFFSIDLSHFLAALQALNLNIVMMSLCIGSVFLLPLLGIALNWITLKAIRKKPWSVSFKGLCFSLSAISALLLSLDILSISSLRRQDYEIYQKLLPLGRTFLSPKKQMFSLSTAIAKIGTEKERDDELEKISLALDKKPNIYLFIIETLRQDFINQETAPNLIQIGSHFPTCSNASSTYLSWFSIFHSNLPHHWSDVRGEWTGGSSPLKLIKSLGYDVRVYSSADLHFYQMDKVIFGENRELADQIQDFSSDWTLQPWERDALVFKAFEKDFAKEEGKEGNLYIFFLDSTHSEYSFPEDRFTKFKPIVKKIDYLSFAHSKRDLELIKNRYRNAIFYIDSLIGSFTETLKRENRYDEAILTITGDHGEEFFEEGALFHGTHLNRYQTTVPLICKFQTKDVLTHPLASHIDIFPTILHHLSGKGKWDELFDGQSLLQEKEYPYQILFTQNGADMPVDFAVQNEEIKIEARFVKETDQLEISSLKTRDNQDIYLDEPLDTYIERTLPGAFDLLLEKR